MKRFNTALLLATIASSALAAAAHGQTAIPNPPGPNDGDNSLHGSGATSIQTLLVQSMNCIGGNNQLGTTAGLQSVAEPTNLYSPAGTFNCSTQSLQPQFSGKYVGTGSGFGRQIWRSFSNQFGPAGINNPFGTWNNVQFAFADSTASQSDLTTYNTNAAPTAGAPIMFPMYVLPVAIAYNPVYGKNANGQDMRFNVQNPQSINGVVAGGLRMSRSLYCGVFNGEVKNFNHSAFTTANGGVPLFDPVNDTSTRWSSDGVPVRLVGRLDRSGTTDIFTRALAAQCGGRFATNAETLPYDRTPGANVPNFSSVRPDTGLSPNANHPVAGTINSVGNQYFTGSAIASVPGGLPANPNGNEGSGLFLVADGSGKVRDAINFGPDYALNGVTLNGKIGYVGSDFIANSPSGSPTLFAAALQVGSTSNYAMPSALAATQAFGTVLPPESNISGAYTQGDTRSVRLPTTGTGPAKRENPLAWYDVLYTGTSNLANPTAGYPITGTTQFLGYTCYTSANRPHMANFLGWHTDGVTQDSAGANRTGILTSTSSLNPGLLSRSNIGVLPNSWKYAVRQTFLTDSSEVSNGQRLGALNLWIQSAPTPGGAANAVACGGKTGA